MSEIPEDILATARHLVMSASWLQDEEPHETSIELICCAILAERRRCAKIASDFSMKPDRSVHPDIPWDQMSDAAKMTAHTTAQQIAAEIIGVEDGD